MRCQIGSSLTHFCYDVSSGSYCTSIIVGYRVMVTHLLPYILTIHCVDSETLSVRNQGVGCALAWVTIALDSESDYPFYPVVQFRRICAGHLWCQISSGSTKLSLNVSSGSYCTSIIVGYRVMVTHLLPYILTIASCGQ